MNSYINFSYIEHLKKPVIIISVLFSLIKVGTHILFFPDDVMLRVVSAVVLIGAVFTVTRFNLRRRMASIIIPLTSVIVELPTVLLQSGGDRFFYIFLIGTGMISLLYLDTAGMVIKMLITSAAVITVVFGFDMRFLGADAPLQDELFNLYALLLIYVVLIMLNRFSMSVMRTFRRMGRRFNTFLEMSEQLIIIVNSAGRVDYISKKFATILGYSNREHLHNLPFTDLFTNAEQMLFFGEMLAEEGYIEKNFSLMVDGKPHWYVLHSNRVREGREGRIARIFECADITPAVEARLAAEASDRTKTEFLADMSHEIRTPLNAVIGISQIELQKRNLPPDYVVPFEKIYTSGSNLLGIINDILDISKIESGMFELRPHEYSLPGLINDTIQINTVRVGSKPIEFVKDISTALPARVYGDELRIKQVLNNLITNAIKYTESGEVVFSVSHSIKGDDVMLRFTVRDSGQGMTEEDMKNIFLKYTRFNIFANHAIEGTGLGLAITKQLVERMGGTISVESEYGKGSTFIFELKQKCVECTLVDFSEEQPAKDFSIKRSPMPYGRVLVVDDVSVNLYIADGFLSFYRLTIEQAESGYEAIEKIHAGKTYDIIFMDHMMPYMDGIETTRRLRDMGYTGTIVALTANALVGNDEMFLQNGFDGFMSKPMNVWELDDLLNKFIRDRHPEEAAKYEVEDAVPLSIVKDNFIAQVLRRDTQKAIATLQEAQTSNDSQAIAAAAHAMKSALANIGEHEAAQMAVRLEEAARNDAKAYLAAHTGVFIAMLEALDGSLGDDVSMTTAADDDASFLNDNLTIIKVACQNYDAPTAFAALDRLEKREWTPQTTEFLADIKKMLYSDSDFDGVVAKISH